jgi:hypothetical protein
LTGTELASVQEESRVRDCTRSPSVVRSSDCGIIKAISANQRAMEVGVTGTVAAFGVER